MSRSRRDFLRSSTASAAALTLGPVFGEHIRHGAATSADETGIVPFTVARTHVRATPIPLQRVRVTGGPLHHAQQLSASYLLALDPDRMLSLYRTRAGLTPKAEPYSGWDAGGRNLTGHIAGHHLSGVSLMYAATGDTRFKSRADYIVSELALVQRANGDGYVGALEGLREAFARLSRGEIKSGGFDLNGLWSPWYTLHKTFAGLRDAYRYTGNSLALHTETAYAAWAERVVAPLTDAQMQQMLNTEHGGMNEVFVDLCHDTGDARWLTLSRRFEHIAFTAPLTRHEDNLSGKHGNCQIPKLIGSAVRHTLTGNVDDILPASFFWDRVVRHHTYASGGHGLNEYFGPPDQLSARVDGRAAETCNVYNMLKLTRTLFAVRPDAAYADFHERALFNHILASIDPTDGRVSYMVPVGRDEQQEYQDPQRDFTCCVGTGMENHAMHGLGVWFESADTIWLNLFVPNTAQSSVARARLALETNFPDGDSATLRITVPAPANFTLAVRRPVWAGDGFRIAVNGEELPQPPLASLYDPVAGGRAGGIGNESESRDSTYVNISRRWTSGDTVTIALPKSLHLEPTRDDATVTAIMWGPLALAADLGARMDEAWSENPSLRPPEAERVLVSTSRDPATFLHASSVPGDFTMADVVHVAGATDAPTTITLRPFHRTHRRRYALYHDLLTPTQFDAHIAALADARAAVARRNANTIATVTLGDPQSESKSTYRSAPADRVIGHTESRTSRGGGGWFEVTLAIDAAAPCTLSVTHFNERGLPAPIADFHVMVNGTTIATYEPKTAVSGFFHVDYEVPPSLTAGKASITVRFEASAASRVIPVFEVRTVRR